MLLPSKGRLYQTRGKPHISKSPPARCRQKSNSLRVKRCHRDQFPGNQRPKNKRTQNNVDKKTKKKLSKQARTSRSSRPTRQSPNIPVSLDDWPRNRGTQGPEIDPCGQRAFREAKELCSPYALLKHSFSSGAKQRETSRKATNRRRKPTPRTLRSTGRESAVPAIRGFPKRGLADIRVGPSFPNGTVLTHETIQGPSFRIVLFLLAFCSAPPYLIFPVRLVP